MGDIIVSTVVRDVVGRLTSRAFNEFVLLWGLDDDVSALKDSFGLIGAVLRDAEAKQRMQEAVEFWLRRLRSASLEVENVLDEISTEAMLQRLHKERGIHHRVRAFLSSHHNRFMVHNRIAHKVRNIRAKLDKIALDRSNFGLTEGSTSADTVIGGDTIGRETSSLVLLSEIYGRDDEIEMVAQAICSKDVDRHDSGDDVRVYAIWGMGGMGKTTLAQAVYNHKSVKTHFELKCWVYVSMEFDVKKLTQGILESIDGCPCQLSRLDKMQESLQDKLRGKRFLIVLDDIWNEDERKWNDVRKALCCGDESSVIMVTTRKQGISRMMAKCPEFEHELGRLSEDDSWSLFKKLAFGGGREEGNIRELEQIGKEIVVKCKGLPLAVRSLGSLMRLKNSTGEWQRVKKSETWELEETDDYTNRVLKLSYDDLQPHLKRCFAYCCLFPKGYKMEKEVLIELWMANGFIPSRGEGDLYALGEDIFDRLVWRSFFQMHVREMDYLKQTCKMHDLMHDLARYVMRHDCTFGAPGKEMITPNEVLHLSSSSPDLVFLENQRSVRSIFIFQYPYRGSISEISKHKYLRVLHCNGTERTLPDSVCKLKHLRYLNMSSSGIKVVPESIVYLQNLQVLLLKGCWNLRKLPRGMRYLRNLQHLDIRACMDLECMPVGMKELARLRVLSSFFVGGEKGLKIGELGGLNLLGGELDIRGLENVRGLEEAKTANLKNKTNLTSLRLSWLGKGTKIHRKLVKGSERNEEVLEGLEPASTLKELHIKFYKGTTVSPSWMVNLRNLVEIIFNWCPDCECIPPLGSLPSLRAIRMDSMYSLKGFHEDDNTSTTSILFPCLEHLEIAFCNQLASLPSNLPRLEKLQIHNCNGLVSLPNNLPKLNNLDIKNCDGLPSLPDELLLSLTSLTILYCEKLTPRHKREIGEDWPKISHIPNIHVD